MTTSSPLAFWGAVRALLGWTLGSAATLDATYGNVWFPNRVAADWAPYRDGHWAWVDPWGWTWVDDAPWGFAVSHYGRWANLHGTWGWVPGPPRSRAYYAPALVVFFGGDNSQVSISSGNVGAVAWFPLGPREVYRPAYRVSRSNFQNVNRSNTVINNAVINNYYDNRTVTNVVYANRRVPGAVVAVPATAFAQSQPVSRAAVRVSREIIVSAPVSAVRIVAPTRSSVHGAAAPAEKPPARVFERPVVARSAPPAAHAGFAAQEQQLTAKPGRPLDEDTRKKLKAGPQVQAPVVKVITPARVAPPTLRPPPAAQQQPEPQPPERRGRSDRSEDAVQRMPPVAPPQHAAQPKAAPQKDDRPAPVARPQARRPEQPRPGVAARPAAAAPPPDEARPVRGATPERGPAANRAEPHPPATAPAPAAARPQPMPGAEPHGREPKPDAGKPEDRKQDNDDRKLQQEEDRKQKG